jgi:hypothetical protein
MTGCGCRDQNRTEGFGAGMRKSRDFGLKCVFSTNFILGIKVDIEEYQGGLKRTKSSELKLPT